MKNQDYFVSEFCNTSLPEGHFGWELFLLTEKWMKALYVKASFNQVPEEYKDSIKNFIADLMPFIDSIILKNIEHIEVHLENQEEKFLDYFTVDHQSCPHYNSLLNYYKILGETYKEFYHDLCTYIVLCDDIAILGGNDNRSIGKFFYEPDGSSFIIVKEPGGKEHVIKGDIEVQYGMMEILYDKIVYENFKFGKDAYILHTLYMGGGSIKSIDKVENKKWIVHTKNKDRLFFDFSIT